jgi:hypothetical protein
VKFNEYIIKIFRFLQIKIMPVSTVDQATWQNFKTLFQANNKKGPMKSREKTKHKE